ETRPSEPARHSSTAAALQDRCPRSRQSQTRPFPGQHLGTHRASRRPASPVILIDANLLLYAYHPRAAQHDKSRAWLQQVLSGLVFVRFAWLTLWAFLRIATTPRVFDRQLSTSEAAAAISSWLAQPAAGIVEPGERHWDILREIVRDAQTPGPSSWTRS